MQHTIDEIQKLEFIRDALQGSLPLSGYVTKHAKALETLDAMIGQHDEKLDPHFSDFQRKMREQFTDC